MQTEAWAGEGRDRSHVHEGGIENLGKFLEKHPAENVTKSRQSLEHSEHS